ncbi:uncharacterized protein LOC123536152 isoform X2 [Mercenaria mercenaria]|nr:uncharacterized protein LOC123536152 isoform X2 [Mercenaria mercenaria]XP_053384101.1 uncharacterized protein LOC123536152 isoform X2 [Mercenaria mercenaria]XP_053384102.1 uncharacterized protein LOC123536152 isoform X2 [Mercenaria mercenaria]
MFQAVMEDMQLQDDRIKALENNSAKIRDEEIQKAITDTPTKGNLQDNTHEYQSRKRDLITQIQKNDTQEDIQQIKDYLIHMSKGLAVEKSMRAENTNTIGSLVDQNNESLNKLHQTIDHHENAVKNSFKDLETDLKAYGDKINYDTDQVIRNFTMEYKEELDKTELEKKEGIKNIADVIEKIQKDVEQIKLFMYNKDKNIAFGKSASESSSIESEYYKGANAATDGVTSGNWEDGSCTHTASEMNPWWQVDLQRPYLINRVVITNRADCCGERLHSLVISVSNEQGSTEEICGHFEGPSTNGATETIQCYSTVFGRYLKIQMNANSIGVLTLCEVEIFVT